MPANFEEILTFPDVPKDSGNGDDAWEAFGKTNRNFAAVAGLIEDAERKAWCVPITAPDGLVEAGQFESWHMPYAFVLLEVRAGVDVEDSSADIDIDITEDGLSIFGSGGYLTIPAGSDSSEGSPAAPDVQYVILQDWNKVRISVVNAPSGGTAAGLKVHLIGYVVWTTF